MKILRVGLIVSAFALLLMGLPMQTTNNTPTWQRAFAQAQATPTGTPAPAPTAVRCPGALPSRLVVGGTARVASIPPRNAPNALKQRPSQRARTLYLMNAGEEVIVKSGPVCADNYAWWEVEWRSSRVGLATGWTAEGDAKEYWMEPIDLLGGGPEEPEGTGTPAAAATVEATGKCPGALPSRLQKDTAARIASVPPRNLPNALKRRPSQRSQTLYLLKAGEEVLVKDGPVCAEGYAWWQVEWRGAVGWSPEGDSKDYWIEPIQ